MNEIITAPKKPLAPKRPASPPLASVKVCATRSRPPQTATQKSSANLSNMILLNCFPRKIQQQNQLHFQAPIQTKNPSLVIPRPVTPIAPKVPHGKMPIYPAPKKILTTSLKSAKLNQESNSKPLHGDSDSRNSTSPNNKYGNVTSSHDFFPTNFQDVKESVYSKSHQIYSTKTPRATNYVNPANKLLMPLGKPSNFVIINPVPRQNELPMPSLDPKVSISTTQLISIHPSSIFPSIQKFFPSKYVPIRPKTIPTTTPYSPTLQKSSTFARNSGSTVSGNKYSRISRSRQKLGSALRKPQKKATRFISQVLSTNKCLEPPDIISNIPVKIERVDAASDGNDEMPFGFKESAISNTATEKFHFFRVSSVTGPCSLDSQDVDINDDLCSENVKKEEEEVQINKSEREKEPKEIFKTKPQEKMAFNCGKDSLVFSTEQIFKNTKDNSIYSFNTQMSSGIKTEKEQSNNNAEDSDSFQVTYIKSEVIDDYNSSAWSS